MARKWDHIVGVQSAWFAISAQERVGAIPPADAVSSMEAGPLGVPGLTHTQTAQLALNRGIFALTNGAVTSPPIQRTVSPAYSASARAIDHAIHAIPTTAKWMPYAAVSPCFRFETAGRDSWSSPVMDISEPHARILRRLYRLSHPCLLSRSKPLIEIRVLEAPCPDLTTIALPDPTYEDGPQRRPVVPAPSAPGLSTAAPVRTIAIQRIVFMPPEPKTVPARFRPKPPEPERP